MAQTFTKGMNVKHRKYGVGVVESVSTATNDEGTYTVYHVRLENGDVRHFTETELKETKAAEGGTQ